MNNNKIKTPVRRLQKGFILQLFFSKATKLSELMFSFFFSFLSPSDHSHLIPFQSMFCLSAASFLFADRETHERARHAIGGLFVSLQRAANYNVWPCSLKRERRRCSSRPRCKSALLPRRWEVGGGGRKEGMSETAECSKQSRCLQTTKRFFHEKNK